MSTNRLFIYDPLTNSAVCIGKGYCTGWVLGNTGYINGWLNDRPELTGEIVETRLKLITENQIKDYMAVHYEK